MDFSLMRVYTKFYISQILHSIKYIEYNNVNYYLQEELAEFDNNFLNDFSKSPSVIKNNNNNFNQNSPLKDCLGESQKCDLENKNFTSPKFNNENNIKNSFEKKLTEEEYNCIDQMANDEVYDLLDYSQQVNLLNNKKIKENSENVKKSEAKKYELIEINKDNEAKYRKLIVYNNHIFSKVEIQGIVVDKRIYGNIEKNNFRHKLLVDDTTGIIEVFIWKSKIENTFNKIRDEISVGTLIRILGSLDNYRDTFEINLEYVEVIRNWKHELIFHKSLKVNQNTLKKSKLLDVLGTLNEGEVKIDLNNLSNNNTFSNEKISNKNIYNKSNSKYDNNKTFYVKKKDFANRILAFFKKYKFSDEIYPENNYIQLKIQSLISNQQFSTMMNDFCRDNNILDQNKFLIESLTIIEENSMGKLIDDEQAIELKLDDEINNEILKMLRMSPEGLNYVDICDRISCLYNNFFMNDFIKYIIEELMQSGKIQSINQNFYQIMS